MHNNHQDFKVSHIFKQNDAPVLAMLPYNTLDIQQPRLIEIKIITIIYRRDAHGREKRAADQQYEEES